MATFQFPVMAGSMVSTEQALWTNAIVVMHEEFSTILSYSQNGDVNPGVLSTSVAFRVHLCRTYSSPSVLTHPDDQRISHPN